MQREELCQFLSSLIKKTTHIDNWFWRICRIFVFLILTTNYKLSYCIFMDGRKLNSVERSTRRIASSDALKAHQVSVLHQYTMCSHPKLTSKLINQHKISSFRTDLLKIIEEWGETNVFEWIVNDSMESIRIYECSIYLDYKIKECSLLWIHIESGALKNIRRISGSLESVLHIVTWSIWFDERFYLFSKMNVVQSDVCESYVHISYNA